MSRIIHRMMALMFALAFAPVLPTGFAQEPDMSPDAMKEFLSKAKVTNEKPIGKGVTQSLRLTLSDGKITHDAHFQSIDETRPLKQFGDGSMEANFRDSYKFNIAAYELANMLGLGDMMPVTVERKYGGKTGAIAWWLPVKIDEQKRLRDHVQPPDPEAFAKQTHKMRVFSALVYDTDRNLGNLLYSESWHIWMIDFTRAFRIAHELQDPKVLTQCDRQLLEQLRQLSAEGIQEKTKRLLTKDEVKALIARRDKIVDHFQKLIAEKGESAVIY